MNAEPPPCGTYAAYQRHKRAGEESCNACKKANADYIRNFRRTNPDIYGRELASAHARERALRRLAREHPQRFRQLLLEEQAHIYAPDRATA